LEKEKKTDVAVSVPQAVRRRERRGHGRSRTTSQKKKYYKSAEWERAVQQRRLAPSRAAEREKTPKQPLERRPRREAARVVAIINCLGPATSKAARPLPGRDKEGKKSGSLHRSRWRCQKSLETSPRKREEKVAQWRGNGSEKKPIKAVVMIKEERFSTGGAPACRT